MTLLSSNDIHQLSAEGMSPDAITHLLIPKEVADMAITPAPMSS
jgi:hypothetical protein